MLKELRVNKGLTQEQLAGLSGIPAPVISQLENGARRPWPAAMRQLAQALKRDVREVFPEEVARRERDFLKSLGLVGSLSA